MCLYEYMPCVQVLEESRGGHPIFWRGCGVYVKQIHVQAWVPFPSSLPLLPSLHRYKCTHRYANIPESKVWGVSGVRHFICGMLTCTVEREEKAPSGGMSPHICHSQEGCPSFVFNMYWQITASQRKWGYWCPNQGFARQKDCGMKCPQVWSPNTQIRISS